MAEQVAALGVVDVTGPRAPAQALPVVADGPRLWALLALGCAALGLLVLARQAYRGRSRRRRRAAALLAAGPGPVPGVARGRRGSRPTRPRHTPRIGAGAPAARAVRAAARRGIPALGAGLGVALLLGDVPGAVLGALAAVTAWRTLRRGQEPAGRRATAEADRAAAAQLPLAADLLAACLAAGASPHEAAGAVGGALGGPLGARLTRVAAEARLGAEPAAAWRHVGQLPEARVLARRLARAASTGAPAVAAVTRLATDARTRQAREAQIRARRAGVMVTGPLGLCFLPAFLLLGVAPVVLGLADALW